MQTRVLLSLMAAVVCAVFMSESQASDFHPILSAQSSTANTDLYPVANLIQGPGVGFDATAPYDKLVGGAVGNWVTDSPGGFPSDYLAVAGKPVIALDLGADRLLSEINVWGQESSNANGVSSFSLRFATAAEGGSGFGGSILYNPIFFPVDNATARQRLFFSQSVTARYVEVIVEDNFFVAPGDGSGGGLPGGDRVGLGEIAFGIIPPPPLKASIELIEALNENGLPRIERKICWSTIFNETYQVQYSSDLSSTNWFDLGNAVIGDGSTNCVFDTTEDPSNRFYRVVNTLQ